ncbi:BrnT family toxin [Brevundimonas sp.]|uniref:BrnT family toxin n=1 Tax=Brevundimonas sp. TaxID=1871086 RepID=UPI002ABC21F8|nr:BrnT family toxin [Brevundimonas sp.]MDZ4364164.1 BrnT family toxin [Brevundimonas sp.]
MIVFDPAKDVVNVAKHGVSLGRAHEFVFEDSLIEADDRFDYQESRWIAYGYLDGRLHVLVFTQRGDTIRVISLRKANQREKRHVEHQRRLRSED